MGPGQYCALVGCLLSAFVVHDLIRGTTGFRTYTFTRAQQPLRYWAWLGVNAWIAGLAFLGAARNW